MSDARADDQGQQDISGYDKIRRHELAILHHGFLPEEMVSFVTLDQGRAK